MTKRKNQALKPRHKLYARNLVKRRGDQTLAYMDTYPDASRTSAPALASRLLANNPQILNHVQTVLNSNGLSLDVLSKKLAEKLQSQKVIVCDNEMHEIPDHNAQLKAVELGMKAHGVLKDVDNSTTYNVQVNQQLVLEKLGERMDKVLEMLGYNIGRDDQGRKVIHNLPTSEAQADGGENQKVDIVDAEYNTDSDSTSGDGVGGEV
jgi:hypothetical protein